MDINEVTTAEKIGEFVLRNDDSPNKIKINYIVSEDKIRDDSPRVYIIVSDGQIMKIGGSAEQGGIRNTMSFYVNAMQGSPGRPRFIVHLLIEKELIQRKAVELYVIYGSKVQAQIPGLFGYHYCQIASYKEMERKCLEDYYGVEGKYPPWNFQENNMPYPRELELKYQAYHKKRIRK